MITNDLDMEPAREAALNAAIKCTTDLRARLDSITAATNLDALEDDINRADGLIAQIEEGWVHARPWHPDDPVLPHCFTRYSEEATRLTKAVAALRKELHRIRWPMLAS